MAKANNPAPAANPTRAAQASAAPAAAKTPKAPKVAKVDPVLQKKIKLLADKNPKREGSASHARFALYKTGMTGEAYILACVALGQDRRNARGDLSWDVEHKYVELTD